MNLTENNLKKIKFDTLSEFGSYCWIAGGAITDYFLGLKMRDIDIFFPSDKARKTALNVLTKKGGRVIFEYPLGAKIKYKGKFYDLSFLGKTPMECINQFDYTACGIAVDKNKEFFYHENYFEHMEKMELCYSNAHPNRHYINKVKRLRRYLDKGFSMDQKNYDKWLEGLIDDHNGPQKNARGKR